MTEVTVIKKKKKKDMYSLFPELLVFVKVFLLIINETCLGQH